VMSKVMSELKQLGRDFIEKVRASGITNPERHVIDRIKDSVWRFERAFGSGSILTKLEDTSIGTAFGGEVRKDNTNKSHPYFAFNNMPEGVFALKEYCQKTDVPRSMAWDDFNVLEELGLVTIHRASGGKPNEIECAVSESLKQPILEILRTYRTKKDLPRVKAEILKIKSQYPDSAFLARERRKESYQDSAFQKARNSSIKDVTFSRAHYPIVAIGGGSGVRATISAVSGYNLILPEEFVKA
ncbi:unnamed protein product, partial [marine sediment metagenome]